MHIIITSTNYSITSIVQCMDLLWTRKVNMSLVMLLFPHQISVHIGLESTRKRINTKFHFIFQRIILTLVASAFIPFTNRTSESASVYNGILWVWAERVYLLFSCRYTVGYDVNDARWARLKQQVIVVKKKKKKKMIHGCYAQPSFHAVTHLIMPLSSDVLYSACLPIQFKREYP